MEGIAKQAYFTASFRCLCHRLDLVTNLINWVLGSKMKENHFKIIYICLYTICYRNEHIFSLVNNEIAFSWLKKSANLVTYITKQNNGMSSGETCCTILKLLYRLQKVTIQFKKPDPMIGVYFFKINNSKLTKKTLE